MNNVTELIPPLLLALAGATLIWIGLSITISPAEFYAANSITLGGNINLRNELKAPAGFLLVAGTLMLAAVFVRGLMDSALLLAVMIYLSYAASRFASMLTDGVPSAGLMLAAATEAFIGLACLIALLYRRTKSGGNTAAA